MIWAGFALLFKIRHALVMLKLVMMKFIMKTPLAQFALAPMIAMTIAITITLAATLTIWFSSYADAATVALDEVIAIVNNEAITRSEYQTRYKRKQLETDQGLEQIPEQIDFDILELLIDERIQAQAAQAAGISIGRAEIENAMANMAAQNNLSQQQLITELETQGISAIQFLRSIKEQRLIQRLVDISVNARVSVSEQEIDYHLQAHKELYMPNISYEISHLYVSTSGKSAAEIERESENVNHIHQGLLQGQSFSSAVRDFSDGENQEEGGYAGWRKENQLPELFLAALRQTPIGGVTEIMKSVNGFHIIKLHAKEGDTKIVTQQRLRHILVQPQRSNLTDREAIDLLNDVANKIRQGSDFEQFARLLSDDAATASRGGALGWTNPGDTAPAFEQAALSLPLNQLSDPVRSRFGYHLIEVLDRRERDISRDIARNSAQRELFKRKAEERYQNWFGRLREGAYIEYVANN